MAEVVLGVGILGVGDEGLEQDFGAEDVDAHVDVDGVGIEGRANGGGLGLFLEPEDLALAADFDHAEAADLIRRYGNGGQGHFSLLLDVVLEHSSVVHLVNLVALKDDHALRLLGTDGVDVLVDGVGGAHVPVGAGALHGGKKLKELAQFGGDNAGPAFADMAVERERFVLGEYEDLAQAGVNTV